MLIQDPKSANLPILYEGDRISDADIKTRTRTLGEQLECIHLYKDAKRSGLVAVDRHRIDIEGLAADPVRSSLFLRQLDAYLTSEFYTPEASEVRDLTRKTAMLNSFVKEQRVICLPDRSDPAYMAIPYAVLMHLANRSPLGLYGGGVSAINEYESGQKNAISTLTRSPYWRRLMCTDAAKVAERFRAKGVPMDLVMVGDGSGALGTELGMDLFRRGDLNRLIHIDISGAMLQNQRKRYLSEGIPEPRVISIQGSALNIRQLLNSRVPDHVGGHFVLHEIFDDLIIHPVYVTGDRVYEMYTIVDRGLESVDVRPFPSSDPIIENACTYFPFLASDNGSRVGTISLEPVAIMREILLSSENVAMYIGDYGEQFILDVFAHGHDRNPLRSYGSTGVAGVAEDLLTTPTNITGDAFPSILYLSSLFGGTVERLSDQYDYFSDLAPGIGADITARVQNIEGRTRTLSYTDVPRLLEDIHIGSQLNLPTFFAAMVTKGL